jgi:hypothetical protein
MAASIQERVHTALREHGPQTVDELLERLTAEVSLTAKNPEASLHNVLRSEPTCVKGTDNRYVYLPAFIRGAAVRVPLAQNSQGLIQDDGEEPDMLMVEITAAALLWPMLWRKEPKRRVTIALSGRPTIRLDRFTGGMMGGLSCMVRMPSAFWAWWREELAAGADSLVLSCQDGLASSYRAEAIRAADLDPIAVAERNAQLRESATEAMRGGQEVAGHELAQRLLGRGAYHATPTPDPLGIALFEPPGPFFWGSRGIVYRADITPALRDIFAERIEAGSPLDLDLLERFMASVVEGGSAAGLGFDLPLEEDAWEMGAEEEEEKEDDGKGEERR